MLPQAAWWALNVIDLIPVKVDAHLKIAPRPEDSSECGWALWINEVVGPSPITEMVLESGYTSTPWPVAEGSSKNVVETFPINYQSDFERLAIAKGIFKIYRVVAHLLWQKQHSPLNGALE